MIRCIVLLIFLILPLAIYNDSISHAEDKKDSSEEITIENLPPVVVKTTPEAGSQEVDATLKEIKVVFSKEMLDNCWSWSTVSKDSFPKIDGKPKYLADHKTCVLPVSLEPGKTYAIWLNSGKFGNFKDKDQQSAVPYLLVFKTKK